MAKCSSTKISPEGMLVIIRSDVLCYWKPGEEVHAEVEKTFEFR
jgi:hypothetical protein